MQRFKDKNFYIALATIFVLTIFADYISQFDFFNKLGLSLLIISILIGMIITNIFKIRLPKTFDSAITFCTKELLRFAIIFYGFRLTFSEILEIGFDGIIISFLIVFTTFTLGFFIGTKVLKLDREITILTSAGSAICGAAAVLATEGTLKNKAYKSTIAVSTVVLFGTISMFLYPYMLKAGLITLNEEQTALYIGGTLHEVAHVVGAGNSFESELIQENSVVVKMLRVMLLAPFLIVVSLFLINKKEKKGKGKILIPWFAVFFILVAVFNSFNFLPKEFVFTINEIDIFLLAMSMMALGLKTDLKSIKQTGYKPILLATILFIWLIFGGLFIIKTITL
ncbi:YeiH family putative sulfate export transporter [Arcobacter sp. CECT 8983]|uniref:YeiH family protein n=1 Tax=Arcobacter sp. CECT 8983 TaxID=2044508 RepID=UPI00100B048F|nr:YeiH family protein [Arcobacter sp. CECT 8983]RXJ89683.1 YeiH family putative sulfate export transporter [Arcobacter sp. CECT 8983]